MKYLGRFRGASVLSYVVLVFFVATVTLFMSRESDTERSDVAWFMSESNPRGQEYTVLLINELLKQLNSSGPLVAINITNVIQVPSSYSQNSNVGSQKMAVSAGKKQGVELNELGKTDFGPTPEPPSENKMLVHFQPVMTAKDRANLFNALLRLGALADRHNFTYMLYSGTLLGSFRHHDIIPWDDDFDLIMEYEKREDIVEVLTQCEPEFEIWVAGARVKFFSRNGMKTSRYPWKWPYIDISFYKENVTHIWDGSMEDDYGDRVYVFPKNKVFPLHKRPLGEYYVNSPFDAYDNLRRTYSKNALQGCMTSHYSHKHENVTSETYKVPCWVLSKRYGFVHREAPSSGKGVKEVLRRGAEVIQTLIVDEPAYAITKPYEVALIKNDNKQHNFNGLSL